MGNKMKRILFSILLLLFITGTLVASPIDAAEKASRQEAKAQREAARAERLATKEKEKAKVARPKDATDDVEDENDSPTLDVLARPGQMLNLPVRSGVTFQVFWIPKEGATATVMLMPGGDGSVGRMVNGQPTGHNFLVRSRNLFSDQGFNVALVGRPSDLSLKYRTTSLSTLAISRSSLKRSDEKRRCQSGWLEPVAVRCQALLLPLLTANKSLQALS